MGTIGVGNRGLSVMNTFLKTGQAEMAAVCEVYGVRMDRALQAAPNAKGYADHRKLLEDQTLDAVLIATPDHWHAQMVTDAAAAGKDIYVEKPLCRTREEGPRMVRAVRVANRICQVGMQQRSGSLWLEAKRKFFDTGRIGKILKADTIWHASGAAVVRPVVHEMPSNLD
jgi:predicted dehydrogenase